MDDETAELREIFVDVTGEGSVTEAQEDDRGSLTRDDDAVTEALRETVARMRDRFEFDTDLDDDYCRVAREFFAGESDAAVADALGTSRETVVRARHDLHLVRERDLDAPFDLEELRSVSDLSTAEAAADLGVSASTVRRYRRALATRDRIRRTGGRYRNELAELLTDADLEGGLDERTYDGLREAAEDIEHDLAF